MIKDDGKNTINLPHNWLRPDVLIASLCINVLALALPIVVLQVYDRVIPNQAEDTFLMLILGMGIVIVVDTLLRIARSIILGWCGSQFEHCEAVRAISRILKADTMSFERIPSGTYLEKIKDIENIREHFSGQPMLTFLDFPFLFLYLGLIWIIAGNLILVPLSLLVIFCILSLVGARKLHRSLELRADIDERRQNFIIETLRGIHTIKSMAMESPMIRRYERLQGQSAQSVYEMTHLNSINQGLGTLLSQCATIAFVSIGSIYVVSNDMTIGALVAGTMLTGRLLQPALGAMGLWHQYQGVRLARDRVNEIFALKREMAYESKAAPSGEGALRITNVWFKYPSQEQDLLRGISLDIKPGEIIGITGANGVGKSTLISIMMGFLHPSEGVVTVDGIDVHRIDPEALRAEMGYVPQKGVLYQGTILENMTLFREGKEVEKAIELARTFGLNEIITKLPNGLDTYIGGTAVDTLPSGVRQKIIMVRALVTDPKILLFDDANANLDLKNDRRLHEMVCSLKGKRTMVLVTHRPSFMRLCDRCYELTDGELRPLKSFHRAPLARAASKQVVNT